MTHDNRPSGTCVAAGPAQFDQRDTGDETPEPARAPLIDQQTCEPVNPHPQPETPRQRAYGEPVKAERIKS